MGQVNVRINSRTYPVACEDGQEEHLGRLAQAIDAKVGELVAKLGQVGEARLLVLAGLLVADELAEVYDELADLRDRPSETASDPTLDAALVEAETANARGAQAIERAADRVESLTRIFKIA